MSLCPIAQMLDDNGESREGLVFFDTRNYKAVYLKNIEICNLRQTNPTEIIGVTTRVKMVKLNSYYSNIGIAGDGGKVSYTIVQRRAYADKVEYIVSDTVGNLSGYSKNEIYHLYDSNLNLNGCKRDKGGKFKFSPYIDTIIIK